MARTTASLQERDAHRSASSSFRFLELWYLGLFANNATCASISTGNSSSLGIAAPCARAGSTASVILLQERCVRAANSADPRVYSDCCLKQALLASSDAAKPRNVCFFGVPACLLVCHLPLARSNPQASKSGRRSALGTSKHRLLFDNWVYFWLSKPFVAQARLWSNRGSSERCQPRARRSDRKKTRR